MARRRFQEGSLRKRGKRNPVWELQWWQDYIRDDGALARRRESRILGLAAQMTKRQAQKAAADFLAPLNQGKCRATASLTFEDFTERYFVPNVFPTLKQSTQKRYRRTLLTHILPAFGPLRLCDIQRLTVQTFIRNKADSGLGWESLDHLRTLLSKVFSTARKWDFFLGENPASEIELPRREPVREKRSLTRQQSHALLEELREPVRTMVQVGLLCGLRVGEILGLRWKDINFRDGQLRVEQAAYRGSVGSPKTRGSRRTLPLPQSLVEALWRFRGGSPEAEGEQLVFHTSSGRPYSDTNLLHRFLKPAACKLGMPWLSWHALRRTHATLLQSAGAPPREAQAQLGHSNVSTTLGIYTCPIPASQRAAVERLERLVTNGDESEPNAPIHRPQALTVQ